MGSKITFRLTTAEITRCNQMLVDTLGCVDAETPEGTNIFFRNAEFTDGYEAHIAVVAARPMPYLEVVIYDDRGNVLTGTRRPNVTEIRHSTIFMVRGRNGYEQRYEVEIAAQEKLL